MLTLSTHQTIGLDGITYSVRTEGGQTIGTYHQAHGSDVVTSPDLPAEDNGQVGPIEAIAAFARVAGIKGWTLSENVTTACSSELTEEVGQRADALGGEGVHVSHLARWADDLGLCPSQLLPALLEHRAPAGASISRRCRGLVRTALWNLLRGRKADRATHGATDALPGMRAVFRARHVMDE